MARDLTSYSEILTNQEKSNVRNGLFAIHGINKTSALNCSTTLTTSCNSSQTTLDITGYTAFNGFTGYIAIESEILYVNSANSTQLSVSRAQLGTVALAHNSGTMIYSIQVMTTLEGYDYNEKTDLSDSDLFGVSVDGGSATIIDYSYNWNKINPTREYDWKRNKECFLWEGVNNQFIKVYDGVLYDKPSTTMENRIRLNFKNPIFKFFNKKINNNKIYDEVTIESVLEDLFTGYSVVYPTGLSSSNFVKVRNLYTKEFATYGDLLKYICKEAVCRIRFRQDKTILLFTDATINGSGNIDSTIQTPVASIDESLININDESTNQMFINTIKGTYLERKELFDSADLVDATIFNGKSIRWTISQSIPNQTIISNYKWQVLTLTGLNADTINQVTYGDYVLLTSGTKEYWCKVSDFNITTGMLEIIPGLDKPSYFDASGRLTTTGGGDNNELEGTTAGTLLITSVTLHVGKVELPIVTKYSRNVNGENKDSALKYPLLPNTSEEIYLKYGYADTQVSKFSGIVKGLDSLVALGEVDNTVAEYNKEYGQSQPIFLYTNKIDGKGNISSIDNTNVTIKTEYASISPMVKGITAITNTTQDADLKVTIKNTLTASWTEDAEPFYVSPSGLFIKVLNSSLVQTLSIGDVLVLKAVLPSDDKYGRYLAFKEQRFKVDAFDVVGSETYIYFSDAVYPQPIGTSYFTFTRYPYSSIILLNELYYRGNPVMEAQQNINEYDSTSIDENDEKSYEITGKFLRIDELQKVVSYLIESYKGTSVSSTRVKIEFELPKRLDLEVGDMVTITEGALTGFSNQKCIIIEKTVSENRTRTERYSAITVGNYTITPSTINLKSTLKYLPTSTTGYSHTGNENKTETPTYQNKENKVIMINDETTGNMQLQTIELNDLQAYVNYTDGFKDSENTIQIPIDGITNAPLIYESLLNEGREGVCLIHGEYMTYKSLANVISGATTLEIIKRGINKTSKQFINNNDVIQFFKVIYKSGAEGLISNSIDIGDGTHNYIKMKSDETDGNIIYLNDGKQQLGGKVVDYYNYFLPTELVVGNYYMIQVEGSSDLTLVGSPDNNKGTIFKATGTTTGDTLLVEQNEFKGMFLGNPNIADFEGFLKYNQNTSNFLFRGNYFNGTAYVRTKEEFISALDCSKPLDGYGGTNKFKEVYDMGLEINKIIIMGNYLDISGLTVTHFNNAYGLGEMIYTCNNYLIPSPEIDEISSLNGTSCRLVLDDWGIGFIYQIKIKNIKLANIGSTVAIDGIKFGIYIGCQDVYLENIRLENIKQRVGNYKLLITDTETGRVQQGLSNIIVDSYDAGIDYIFYNLRNLKDISIKITSAFTNPTTSWFFYDCINITNFFAIKEYPDASQYFAVNFFKNCSNLINIDLQKLMCRKIMYSCDSVDGLRVTLNDNFSSPFYDTTNSEYLFEYSWYLSNFEISQAFYYSKHFNACKFLSNIDSTTNAQHNKDCAYINSNSVTWDRDIVSEPSGFVNPELITVSYDSSTRKITLTGTVKAYYKGNLISELVSGWVSPAHSVTNGIHFLYYDGNSIIWDTSVWTFDKVQIAFVNYGSTSKFGVKETHGLMQWQSHQEAHETIGTYRKSGGDLSSWVANSTVAGERRPQISECVIKDEDITITNVAHTTEKYTNLYLTGSGTSTFIEESATQNEICMFNGTPTGTQPTYNQFTGGAWQQTLMTNNSYQALWLIAIPVTSDSTSQYYRFVWMQGQSEGTLSAIEALSPADLNKGTLPTISTEFVFIQKVIIQYTAANWKIISVTSLTGNKSIQASSSASLSSVSRDSSLNGNGTSSSPLSVSNIVPITTITGTITLDSTHYTVLCNSSSPFTVNLPASASSTGVMYTIKNINTGTVTIDGNGSETIDGATTKTLPAQYSAYTIQCNGSNWFILNSQGYGM